MICSVTSLEHLNTVGRRRDAETKHCHTIKKTFIAPKYKQFFMINTPNFTLLNLT